MSAFEDLFSEMLKGIEPSAELRRIVDMPRRDPEEIGHKIAGVVTRKLRLRWPEKPPKDIPHELRYYQALALVEVNRFRGALIPLPVGAGKTIITALLPTVCGSKRPVLLVPAKLREKTERDLAALAQWWRVHPNIQVISYELLQRRPDLLLQLGPDMIMCDEAYRIKNPKRSRWKRINRYMRHYPKTVFVCLSGSFQKKGFMDWWHLQRGCLPAELAILPHSWPEAVEWDQALGPNKKQRRPVGALSLLCGPKGGDYEETRKAFGERFRLTPGIITCPGGSCDASLEFEARTVRHPEIEALVAQMRATWETPDGTPFTEASDLWRHARELANGYVYRWKVPGPKPWMAARREAAAFVREVLQHSRKLDTEMQVYQAYPDDPRLREWKRIKPTFEPETEVVWFTHDIVDMAVEIARKTGALIWTEHVAAGEMIRERHGLPYFGAMARCTRHGSILDWPGGACAVSTTAVGEGQNLQDRFSTNVILNITPGVVEYEQICGRTHRQGQEADLVEVLQLMVVQEQRAGLLKAIEQAEAAQDIEKQVKKLCLADVVWT